MADPGQVVQEQKSKQGKELIISNNGSAFHLSSPWDQAISAMKKGLATCAPAASNASLGKVGGCCGLFVPQVRKPRVRGGGTSLGATLLNEHMHVHTHSVIYTTHTQTRTEDAVS